MKMLFRDSICLLIALGVVAYFYLARKLNYWNIRNVPHDKPVLLFGNLLDVILANGSIGKYLANLYNKFDGPYFGFFALHRPHLVLKDPDMIKRIMISEFNVFPNRLTVCDKTIDPMISNSLLGIEAPHWKLLRSKLSPMFSSGKIKMMIHLMKECGENMQSYINTALETNVDAKELAERYSTDIIATCVFGITTNSFVVKNNEFKIAAKQIFDRPFFGNLQSVAYFVTPALVEFFRFKFIPEEPIKFLRELLMEVIHKRETDKNKRHDLIDILIELKNEETVDNTFQLCGDALVAQAVLFLGAGQETTSLTIGYTLHELCLNKKIQDRLRKEILEVIQNRETVTYEALQEMKYLHMVISETLRKYPLTPFLHRVCTENYKIPETGLEIESGMHVMISQQGLHWDPKYFPNPEKYDPERFNKENKHMIPPYVYLPFGNGPRNCIGERLGLMITKLGIISIIKNFEVVKNAQTRDPLIFTGSRLLHAQGGLPVTFRRL